MPTIRDALIPIVDGLRRDIVDEVAGLRVHTVVRRIVTYGSGSVVGDGAPTSTVDFTFDPVPRVRSLSQIRRTQHEFGKPPEEGDIFLDRVSVVVTEVVVNANQDLFYLVDNEPYRLINVEERYLDRVLHLRRTAARPTN